MRPVLSLILRRPKAAPIATFQNSGTPTVASAVATCALTTGAAFPSRLVAVIIASGNTNSAISAVFDGTNNALSFGSLSTGSGGRVSYVVGLVPSGTTSSLAVTFSGNETGILRFGCYTIDSFLLNSMAPSIFGSTATSAATSDTLNPVVTQSNSIIIAADVGGNNVVKTFSGTPAMTSDNDNNVTKIGHANGVAIGVQALTINWTPASAAEVFGAMVFR